MDDETFMAAYGNAALTEYNIPTAAEIEAYYAADSEEIEVDQQLRTEEAEPTAGPSGSNTHMEDIGNWCLQLLFLFLPFWFFLLHISYRLPILILIWL